MSRAWVSLHEQLVAAAADGFAHVAERCADEFEPRVQRAARSLAKALPADEASQIADYAQNVQGVAERETAEQIRLVALGLRLSAQIKPHLRFVEAGPRGTGIDTPLDALKGVGPAMSERLAERQLTRMLDLLLLLPLEYLDRRRVTPLQKVRAGRSVTTEGVVVRSNYRRGRGRRMLEIHVATEPGEKPALSCIWFRAFPGMSARFDNGVRVRLSGMVTKYRGTLQITHPDVALEGDESLGLQARYPEIAGVSQSLIRKLCAQACARFVDEVPDAVPVSVAEELSLPTQADALRVLHLGADDEPSKAEIALLNEGAHPAQERLVFDDLFALQLAVGQRRGEWAQEQAPACVLSPARRDALNAVVPFSLTDAQQRVVGEVLDDLERPRPMHRLLQGDVGSGKTVIAFFAAVAAIEAGRQAAIMAPTEILARQHHAALEPWCAALGIRSALLTASTPRAVRESLLALADASAIQLLIGTHALLAPRVRLPNLGLAVIDEQHRFGVLQRARLRERGAGACPHILVMTATPIPRSLALTLYGDLDLSVLDEKPPGRLPIDTHLYWRPTLATARAAARGLAKRLERGEQAFVVCPLVEASEKLDVADATSAADRIAAQFPDYRVALVHGRMPADERQDVLDGFRRGDAHVLVSTTVIEVGIDVPGATVMVVEHAERFGLAQLHQLRGRVGRSDVASVCVLLTATHEDTPAGERLAAVASTNDGFEIAEVDLAHRGPGELYGTRQAGIPRLRFADLRRHGRLLGLAQDHARRILDDDRDLQRPEHAGARRVLEMRGDDALVVGPVTP